MNDYDYHFSSLRSYHLLTFTYTVNTSCVVLYFTMRTIVVYCYVVTKLDILIATTRHDLQLNHIYSVLSWNLHS